VSNRNTKREKEEFGAKRKGKKNVGTSLPTLTGDPKIREEEILWKTPHFSRVRILPSCGGERVMGEEQADK